MKISLLGLLLLPLSAFAQSGPTNYMQQNMQSRQDFNRMTNQRTMDFSRQMQERQFRNLEASRAMPNGQRLSAEAFQAKQQKAEQEATDKLARLAQEQQRKREEHPAPNPQQAAAQQKADDKQLNLLAVKNYHDVFLPGQIYTALQARQLSLKGEQTFATLNKNLLEEAWWNKQNAAQLPETVKAYGDSLTSLAASLLRFDLASPPATPVQLTASRVDEMLAKGAFDQNAAKQIIEEVALAEKLIAGKGLAEAVVNFQKLTGTAASNPELQGNPKKLRKAVMASLRDVNTEMQRYDARIISLSRLPAAQGTLLTSTAKYLAKNGN